jgi:hypothetical protein
MYGQLHAGDSGRPVQVRGRLLPLALELATRPEPIPDGDSGSGLSKLSRIDATEASWQSAGDKDQNRGAGGEHYYEPCRQAKEKGGLTAPLRDYRLEDCIDTGR